MNLEVGVSVSKQLDSKKKIDVLITDGYLKRFPDIAETLCAQMNKRNMRCSWMENIGIVMEYEVYVYDYELLTIWDPEQYTWNKVLNALGTYIEDRDELLHKKAFLIGRNYHGIE